MRYYELIETKIKTPLTAKSFVLATKENDDFDSISEDDASQEIKIALDRGILKPTDIVEILLEFGWKKELGKLLEYMNFMYEESLPDNELNGLDSNVRFIEWMDKNKDLFWDKFHEITRINHATSNRNSTL